MNDRPLLVTAAVIRASDRYLLTRRPADTRYHPLRWEFPGGKVEFGEDPAHSLIREIREELAIGIRVDSLLGYSSWVYVGGIHVVLLAFRCRIESGEIRHDNVADHAWVRYPDLAEYDITEADRPLIALLGSNGQGVET